MCVNNSITREDSVILKKFLVKSGIEPLRENPTYQDEVQFIRDVQHEVLKSVPLGNPLPYGKPREPRNICEAIAKSQSGACCDRSRLIEKILRMHCFKTRHVYMCSIKDAGCKLKVWLSCNIEQHAVSEVLTKKGWLVVDSNAEWMSLDKQNQPYSIKSIQCERHILWEKPMRSDMKKICKKSFTFLYGLYSRSGKLYPPFLFCFPSNCPHTQIKFCFPFPDINWRELLYNLKCEV